jgi:hypothetical protein
MDTDSYVKWGTDLASRMPDGWVVDLRVVESYVVPSQAQVDAATRERVVDLPFLSPAMLSEYLRDHTPDVLVLAVRGHVVPYLARFVADLPRRPVIVTGMPGIVSPPQEYDIELRAAADVLVLHSRRELREHAAAASAAGKQYALALESLPLPRIDRGPADDGAIVFATQALVPPTREQRLQLVARLADAARAHPQRSVVIKTRSVKGEAETHRGGVPYDELLRELPDAPPNLVVSTGPMAEHLRTAAALVTVSSTALLEAVAAGVPAVAISDFGVDDSMMTSVFEGSGLLGTLDDVVAGDFRTADAAWLDDNYFHDPAEDDWIAVIMAALATDERAEIPAPPGGPSGLYFRLDALTPWRGTVLEPLERAALGLARALNRAHGR